MKYLSLLLLTSCSCSLSLQVKNESPLTQCQKYYCHKAAEHEGVGLEENNCSYDDLDDTCICQFKNGKTYTVPRK